MALDIEEQYDHIYRYCYFKLHHAQTAEDMTQETFLRYWERYHPLPAFLAVKYLYTIAGNLCTDEYRRQKALPLDEVISEPSNEANLHEKLSVRAALSKLSVQEQELLLLRYVNEVPIGTIAKLLDISRFAVYRKLKSASTRFETALRQEGFYDTPET